MKKIDKVLATVAILPFTVIVLWICVRTLFISENLIEETIRPVVSSFVWMIFVWLINFLHDLWTS